MIGSVKLVGPVVPKLLTAVMKITELPATVGVPLSKQAGVSVAHDGSAPVEQVGVGLPVTTI